MTQRRLSRWVVSISTENDNPHIFGPYPEARAERIAASFNAREAKRSEADALGDFLHATAYPLEAPGSRELVNRYLRA